MRNGLIIACDLGGSSFRAALIDGSGHTVARHARALSASAASEADPAVWWQALREAVDTLLTTGPGPVAAIAISAFTRTQVLVGADGIPQRPAVLWGDTRAAGVARELKAACPPEHPETAGLSAFHPLARLAWLRREEPWSFAPGVIVMEPKDWLNRMLTGIAATDPISMARLLASRDLMPVAGLDPAIMPTPRAPVSMVGPVRPGLPGALSRLAGVPVITMANDTWASVVGLGAMRPGLGYNLSGTTEVLGVASRKAAEAHGLLAVDWSGGDGALWQLGGPSQCGGDTVAWLLELLKPHGQEQSPGDALERLLSLPRSTEPLLFLPHLQGERTPFWDAGLRGAFVGLCRSHGPTDLACAVLEGIAFLNRLVLDRAEAATGDHVREIRFGGGGASNARWQQMKADAMGRTVVTATAEEPGLAGAAIAARTALGQFPDLVRAQDELVTVATRCEPEPVNRERLNRLYALFVAAGEALAPISRKLAAGI